MRKSNCGWHVSNFFVLKKGKAEKETRSLFFLSSFLTFYGEMHRTKEETVFSAETFTRR